MENLKKSTLTITLVLCTCINVVAQTNSLINKAFANSYNYEYKYNYPLSIAEITNVYQEASYEMNARLGWLQYLAKNYTTSAKYYEKAIALKPNAVEPKLGYVKPLAALESWDIVLKQYEAILKIDDQNTTANYYVGMIQYNRKSYELASKYFEKVITLFPFDYSSSLMLAWSYLNQGKTAEAKNMFFKTLLIMPDDVSANEGLSKIK